MVLMNNDVYPHKTDILRFFFFVFYFFSTSCIFSLLLFIHPVDSSSRWSPVCIPSTPLRCDWSSLTAGGMRSVRSVCPVAAALTALFLSAVMLRAAASVALVLWADAVTCVGRVMRGGRHGGRWNAFPWKPCSRDGGGRPARGVVPGGRTDLRQG